MPTATNIHRLTTFNPPTGSPSHVKYPVGVDARLMNTTCARVTWQWRQSEILTSCYTPTYVRYQPQGGSVSSVWVKSNATSTDLTGLQCDTSYTITVAVVVYGHESSHLNMESDSVSLHPSCGSPGIASSIIIVAAFIGAGAVAVLIAMILVLVVRYKHTHAHIRQCRNI